MYLKYQIVRHYHKAFKWQYDNLKSGTPYFQGSQDFKAWHAFHLATRFGNLANQLEWKPFFKTLARLQKAAKSQCGSQRIGTPTQKLFCLARQ